MTVCFNPGHPAPATEENLEKKKELWQYLKTAESAAVPAPTAGASWDRA